MVRPTLACRYAMLLVSACIATSVHALVSRTFVSGTGSDANPCSITTPCRSFAAALAQTSPSGQIVALDSAGYGPVIVSQAVSIIAAPGVFAAISAPTGQDAVTVTAAPTDVVVLRGLTISSTGSSVGVRILTAFQVHVESCVFDGIQEGIVFLPSVRMMLFVLDSVHRNSTFLAHPSSSEGATSMLLIARSAFIGQGLDLTDIAKTFVDDSTIHAGIAVGTGDELTDAVLSINRSTIAGGAYCIEAGGSGARFVEVNVSNSTLSGCDIAIAAYYQSKFRLNGNQITANRVAIQHDLSGGVVYSMNNNLRASNVDDGIAALPITPY
jgi:hypothetical protein